MSTGDLSAVLGSVLQRLDRLEQQTASPASEQLSTNYTTVDQFGNITATFEGLLVANQGLELPVGTDAQWGPSLRPGGGAQGLALLGAHFTQIPLSRVQLLAQIGAAGTPVVLLDENGASSFAQDANPAPAARHIGDPAMIWTNTNSTAASPSNALFEPLSLAGITLFSAMDPGARFGAGGALPYRYVCRNTGIYLGLGSMAFAAGTDNNITTLQIANLTQSTNWATAATPGNTIGTTGISTVSLIAAAAGDRLTMQALLGTGQQIEARASGGSAATFFGAMQVY